MRSRKPKKPAARAAKRSQAATKTKRAARRFARDLMVRGEAAPADVNGNVPLEATHEITKQNADGSVEVKRVRFKAF